MEVGIIVSGCPPTEHLQRQHLCSLVISLSYTPVDVSSTCKAGGLDPVAAGSTLPRTAPVPTDHPVNGWTDRRPAQGRGFLAGSQFPGGSDSKASIYNAGDPGSIPGLGRSPEGNGNPLQYYCLENPMDRGSWQTIGLGVTK